MSALTETLNSLSERVRHLEGTEDYDIGDGAPSHFAAEGRRYWDRTNDASYINNDGLDGWTLIGGGAAGSPPHTILSAPHTDTTAASVSRGALMTGQAAAGGTTWQRLEIGPGNSVLMSDGVDAQWQMPAAWWSGGWVPLGGIILWSGAVATIPFNWRICNGANGTPDLRDRFVVGAGGAYAVDATGGAAANDLSHTHTSGTYSTDNDTHDHSVDAGLTANDTHDHSVDAGLTANDTHGHDVTGGTTAGGTSHTHGPGSLATGTASANDHLDEADPSGPNTSERAHTHQLTSGATGAGTGHTHAPGTQTTDNDTHSHGPGTLDTDNDTHSHGPGTLDTDNDTHNHSVDAGNSGNSGNVAQENRPPYYALAYIMRIS